MASFLDNIPKFNPYVQQLPVEAMVQVGMAKQQAYEQNVTKIQTQIDNVAGLDILRGVDKKYLQSKLNELGNKLTTLASGDFSNFQLVNSVGGMTNQIAKDDLVKNAVSSTTWYRDQRKKIQKDIDDGKSDPSNIYNFDKQASVWLNSDKVGESFSGQYTPHFDIFKFAKETFDAVLPDGYSFDQIYQLGADGKPLKDKSGNLIYSTTMTRLEKEGKFPKKVQETVAQIFSDPRVSKQLNISGEYNYRNYDENALLQKIGNQKQTLINDYSEKIAELNARKKFGEDVQEQIDVYQQRLDTVNENYDSLVETVKVNPDAVRGLLYKEDVNSRYVTMFGQIKSKEQVMANPAWQAQFDMQKEANAQSRWAQTEQRQRLEFSEDMAYKWKKLEQDKDLAMLSLSIKGKKGAGLPEDVSRFEQGNQFSDIDVIRLAEKDYDDAAQNFTKGSIGFIWDNAGWSELPRNKKAYDNLIKSGKSADEAKYTLIKSVADAQNVPLEEFVSKYVNGAVTKYNTLTEEQKRKNPELVDQYNNFKKTEKAWKSQQVIKQSIDAQTEQLYGSEFIKDDVTKNIKEQKIKYNGKDWTLTKDDQYDLALYLEGNISSLGTLGGVDEGVRRAGKAAKARLDARGKGELADGIIYENLGRRAYYGGPVTAIRDAFADIAGLKNVYRTFRYAGDSTNPFKQSESLFEKIHNSKFAETLKGKAEVIRKAYNIMPNLKAPIFTGDGETDKDLLYNVKRWAGEYSTKGGGRINASGDFGDFRKLIGDVSDPSKITLSAQPTLGPDGDVRVEVVAYDPSNLSRKGGMTLQPDEAIKLGIDINSLYESRDVSTLRNLINYNKGQSSKGSPAEKSTYIQGDTYYDNNDFVGLRNSGYNAKGNFIYSNGQYYPYIYVTDGQRSKVRQLTGSPNLGAAVSALLEINPTFVNMLLNEK